MRKAYVVSTFDMVNVADLDLLRQVQEKSDEMAVGVLTDELATQLHGRAPVVPQEERLGLVEALRVTDEVVLCGDAEALAREGFVVYTDEEELAAKVDVVLVPARRSASPELRAALAHGHVARTQQGAHA